MLHVAASAAAAVSAIVPYGSQSPIKLNEIELFYLVARQIAFVVSSSHYTCPVADFCLILISGGLVWPCAALNSKSC